jgi:hypothetical protein
MEDAALPGDDQLVSAVPAQPKSDLDLAALDQDDELALAEETQISSLVVPKKIKTPDAPSSIVVQKEDSSALTLAKSDSSVLSLAKSESSALDDDDSVLGSAGSSPQLGLAGDSGFDVLVAGEGEPGDDSDILLVAEEKTEIAVAPVAEVVEFVLEPSPLTPGDDDSESSSQVIAIDVGMGAATHDADSFGFGQDGGFEGFGFDSGFHQDSPAASASDPFGAGASALPDAFTTPAVSVSPTKKPAVHEEEYSTGMLISLISLLVFMLIPGMMLIDTVAHMWSWGDPFVLNSILMGTIAGWFGL